MTEQQKRIYLPLIGLSLLGLLVGLSLAAWKRFSKPASSSKVVRHAVETPPDEVLARWTKERMSGARPVPLPNVSMPGRGKQRSRRAAPPSGPSQD